MLINPDQTGYVKGRYIGENVRLIYDLIHYTDKLNQKGIAIFLETLSNTSAPQLRP